MSKTIYIYTGPVQSGKTTAVYKWSREQKSVGGFLTPDIGGLRYAHFLATKQWQSFETQNPTEIAATISIGKFNFFQSTFHYMQESLLTDLSSGKEWIVIDELGKLEVKGEGLAPTAQQVITAVQANKAQSNLILMIREELLSTAIEVFDIEQPIIIRRVEELSSS